MVYLPDLWKEDAPSERQQNRNVYGLFVEVQLHTKIDFIGRVKKWMKMFAVSVPVK